MINRAKTNPAIIAIVPYPNPIAVAIIIKNNVKNKDANKEG